MSNGAFSEQSWIGDEPSKLGLFQRTQSSSSALPRRPATAGDATPVRGMKLSRQPEPTSTEAIRNAPLSKGKNFARGDSSNTSRSNFAQDSWRPQVIGSSSYDSRTRPSTTDGSTSNGRSRFRGSLLVVASDALGFKFGRRRPSVRQPAGPVILPGVIEISAATNQDEELEERNRLREMAAQALGLPLTPSQESNPYNASLSDDDDEQDKEDTVPDTAHNRWLGHSRDSESPLARTPHDSNVSVSASLQPQPHPLGGRFRSGSMAKHSPSNSTHISPIPSFPTTVSALNSFKQSAGMHPKYYSPSSLRIFALSKNWKNRYLILSSPATLVTRGEPAVSYLHLFKSSNPDDKELERLEINEDSVVFVAEEEVAGKKQVVKVGGTDVGAMRKEFIHEEGGHTMWFLSISDHAEGHRWITNIKNAILGQRTVRAGLIPAHTLGNNEPRGDMDVMLTMRTQGFVATTSQQNNSQSENNYASSISSQSARSQATASKPLASAGGAVSALKGLFANSNRPRSASRAASIDSDRHMETNEESFTSMGSNLLNFLRSGTPQPDTQSTPTIPSSPAVRHSLPFSGPTRPIDRPIDRKILPERQQPLQWAQQDRTIKSMSVGSSSLQPPPRKRWMSVGAGSVASSSRNQSANVRQSMESTTSTLERAETEPPSSPTNIAFTFPDQRPRAPSLQSVSTYGSDPTVSFERASCSTKRSSGTRSTRRWSRQGILPQRSTPPSGPPPAVPSDPPHPFSLDQAPSPVDSQGSNRSVLSGLPTFSKRTSISSAHSVGSNNTGQSHSATNGNTGTVVIRAPVPHHRVSVPPPRPAPTSALPPAPTEPRQEIAEPLESPSTKSSFRNSAQRTFRLSLMAPRPPPSTNLPPRPDEPEYQNHRRSSSGSGSMSLSQPPKLESIPQSPSPPLKALNPFPPPIGPLPPTPAGQLVTPTKKETATKRTTSLKQRLRILSAPSSGSQASSSRLNFTRNNNNNTNTNGNTFHTMHASPTPHSFLTTSPPATPIAEKITLFQNDPSFLQMHTPITPVQMLSHPMFNQPEEFNGLTSLSPPPRRGSKQLLEMDFDNADKKSPTPNDLPIPADVKRHFSISRPESLRSVKTASSRQLLDSDVESLKNKSPLDEHRSDSLESGTAPNSPQSPTSPLDSPKYMPLSNRGSVVSLSIFSASTEKPPPI